MFTASNVASTAASAASVGPVAAVVPPSFQIIGASVAGSSSSSSSTSSSSSVNVTNTSPATWRITPLTQTIIKQPSVVSIINGNSNGSSTTSSATNTNSITIPNNGNMICISTATTHQLRPISTTSSTGNIILQSPQTIRLVSSPLHTSLSTPTFTLLNNSNLTINGNVRQNTISTTKTISSSSLEFKPGTCIDTPTLGGLTPITFQKPIIAQQIVQPTQIKIEQFDPIRVKQELTEPANTAVVSNNDSLMNNSQDPEIEIFVNNVVSSFSLGCPLNLRKIALEGTNVIFKRDQAMVLKKIRKPYCSANIWSSGKVTVTGATSEDDAKRGARCIARAIQRLGFKVRFRHYRVVNCLATCTMPWPIDIIKLSRTYPECVSYEPEIHPGATVRLPDKAVLKVFTTGNVTLTAPSVDRINAAVTEVYPKLFECRKLSSDRIMSVTK